MRNIVIDHVEGISVDFDKPPIPNSFIFTSLRSGIIRIAQVMRDIEIKKYESKDLFELDHAIDPMIPNYHSWFVQNITNYARSVALFDLMIKEQWHPKDLVSNRSAVKDYCTEYVKRSVPIMYRWRNKIVAHPSATDPQKNDDIATLHLSMTYLIGYYRPYYEIGRTKWIVDGIETPLQGWSLTKMFDEEIGPRFWPEVKLEEIK